MPACRQVTRAMASMMTTTSLQQGQQSQLEDGNTAITTMATTPSWIKGNNAIVTRKTTLSQRQQGCLRINNGNDTIIMRATIAMATVAKTPAHQWQQCHHNEGNNASSMTSDRGDKASSTMAETHLRIDNGNNAIMTRATIAIVSVAEPPAHQW
jgi:hypothetical protein